MAQNGRVTSAPAPRDVVILGSTGSIGTQAIEVVEASEGRFCVRALAASRSIEQLLAQAEILRPEL
ncbi:MAG: hypothetical protein WAN00_18540, partial [Trebonia sp.]